MVHYPHFPWGLTVYLLFWLVLNYLIVLGWHCSFGMDNFYKIPMQFLCGCSQFLGDNWSRDLIHVQLQMKLKDKLLVRIYRKETKMKLHFWQLAPKASCANLLMTFFFYGWNRSSCCCSHIGLQELLMLLRIRLFWSRVRESFHLNDRIKAFSYLELFFFQSKKFLVDWFM